MKKLKYILNSILITFLLFFSSENILIYGMKQELNYNNKLKYGIENISAKINKKLKSKKWALICNNSSIDSLGKRTLDLLLKRNIKIIKIIAPEHGSSGKYLAEHNVPDSKDEITKIPIYSAHKSTKNGRKINDNLLKDIDGIIFDIQDVGMRHYTYISTLCEAIDAAKKNNKTIIIFDRPNPLGGLIDGPLVSKGFESFISRINIPLRHGLTIGECANYYNFYQHNNKAKINIVPMQNYTRNSLESNLLVGLSPNIPNINSCHSYAIGGLLGELNPFHIGIGTESPFSLITLPEDLIPKHTWYQLKNDLKKYGINCKNINCMKNKISYYGLECKIDPNTCPTINVIATIIETMQNQNIKFKCGASLDKAFGNDLLNKFSQKIIDKKVFLNHYQKDLDDFYKKLIESKAIIYEPLPFLYDSKFI